MSVQSEKHRAGIPKKPDADAYSNCSGYQVDVTAVTSNARLMVAPVRFAALLV